MAQKGRKRRLNTLVVSFIVFEELGKGEGGGRKGRKIHEENDYFKCKSQMKCLIDTYK